MMIDSFEKAKKAEDTILDLHRIITSRKQSNWTWLKLSEIHRLQNLEEATEIAKYVVQGILTEPEAYYSEVKSSFYQLNFDKFKESLETLLTINRLIYGSHQWIRAAKDRKALIYYGNRIKTLPSRLQYWDSRGESDLANQILKREKGDFEAFIKEMRRRELAARTSEQQYTQQVCLVVDSLLSKEDSKYPNVRLFGNYT